MREKSRRLRPALVQSVDMGDRDTRQFLVTHVIETTEVDAIHASDRRIGADAEGAHAATAAEPVLVDAAVEQVFRQLDRKSVV